MFAKDIKTLSLILFFFGLIGILGFRIWQVKTTKVIPFSPQESSFSFKPPSDALKGKLINAQGKVEKEEREKEEFVEVAVEAEILQGEKLATRGKSQAIIEFSDFVKIDLDSSSEIGFVNLTPSSFLISQSSGFVVYKLLQDNTSVSVRSLHALLTFYSGEGEVLVEEEEITITILSGKAKLALVDLENKTHVWELERGQKVLIDDTERRVEMKPLRP